MLKKIVIASAILATSSSLAFAEGMPYVGADIGLNNNTFSVKNNPGNSTTHFTGNGLNGGVFAGYGATVSNNVYLGGEAFVNGGSITSSTKVTDNFGTTDKLKTTYSYGLDFVPGYNITNSTKVYAKAGVVRTRFKLSQVAGAGSNLVTDANSETITGGRLGLGVQTEVAKNVDVRGEYVHTSYNSFSTYGNKVTPRNNQVNFGVVYGFG